MPAAGECKEGQVPGDSSGCTWRTLKDFKHVNSTCVNNFVDEAVEKYGADCFNKCPEPHNDKTACYTQCFAQTINGNETVV